MLTISNPTDYSDWIYCIGSAISFLEDAFEGLLHTILDNWLISNFLFVIIFISCIGIMLEFIDDFSFLTGEHIFNKHRKLVLEARKEQRYQEHKNQSRSEAEERYRQRFNERREAIQNDYKERLEMRLDNERKIIDLRKKGFITDSSGTSYDIESTIEKNRTKDIKFVKKDKNND